MTLHIAGNTNRGAVADNDQTTRLQGIAHHFPEAYQPVVLECCKEKKDEIRISNSILLL